MGRSALLSMTLATLGALGCGGRGEAPSADTMPSVPPAAPGAPGAVVEVRMTGDGVTTASYEPDSLTLTPGTTLRFVNVSGWPHNISFWPDSVPPTAVPVLRSAMTNTVGDLQGELLIQANQTYEVSFAGAPEGEYRGYCTPHIALGMRIWITVRGQ